ncbi:MAG TPA: hypothetical protein VJ779_10335 [Acetobacteraceae bacterium]|nr:hypothetical protein [Acetobacteraceae bacterium]
MFGHFTVLFVTLGEARLQNVRQAVADLNAELHDYYRLAVFAEAVADFLGPVWGSVRFRAKWSPISNRYIAGGTQSAVFLLIGGDI